MKNWGKGSTNSNYPDRLKRELGWKDYAKQNKKSMREPVWLAHAFVPVKLSKREVICPTGEVFLPCQLTNIMTFQCENNKTRVNQIYSTSRAISYGEPVLSWLGRKKILFREIRD